MTAACRQEKVDQEFIKSKCGHNILLDHCILASLWVIDGQANNFAILFQRGSERGPNSISKIRQMSKIQ
jgi:hypothetical protein